MGMSGGGKGQGGPMPNPSGFGGGFSGGFKPGMGYAGGNPNFNEMQPGRMGSPGPNETMPYSPPTMANPGFGPTNDVRTPSMDGRGWAGGDPGFSERMGNPTMPPAGAGGASPQVLGSILKRWDGNGVLPNQPGVPDAPQMGFQPGGGINQPPGGPPQGVPGMDQRNFGAPNAQDPNAMALAQATGNQGGLNAAGSYGTNSAVNAAGPGSAGWNPQGVANAGVMNGPASFKVPAFAAQSARAQGLTPQQYAARQGNTGIGANVTWDQVTG